MVDVSMVREELGSPSQEDISDTTLTRLISEEKTLYGAAYRAALILARKYAFQPDYARGNYRESSSQISKAWQKLADDLKVKATLAGSAPTIGGIGRRSKPDFWRGMFDDNWS